MKCNVNGRCEKGYIPKEKRLSAEQRRSAELEIMQQISKRVVPTEMLKYMKPYI